MKALSPDVVRIRIARRFRRVLLLEIILIFSLYLLLFTVIHSLLNYESMIMRKLTNQFELNLGAQEIENVTSQEYQLAQAYVRNPTEAGREFLVSTVRKANQRVDALIDTGNVFESFPTEETVRERQAIDYLRQAHTEYRLIVTRYVDFPLPNAPLAMDANVSEVQLEQSMQEVVAQARRVKSITAGDIATSQAVLADSLQRRTALLGVQALLVIGSLVWIAFGYIAPAFERVLVRLKHQNAELKQADKIKMEFLSIASHQLKTPLSGLKWNISLLSRKKNGLTEKEQGYLRQSRSHTDAMVRLVSNFLNVSRIEQGRLEYHLERTHIVPILKSVCSIAKAAAEARSIKVQIEAVDSKATATVDPLLFKQVLQNLIDNAILYNLDHGNVTISVLNRKNECVIKVADTGLGIKASDQDKVFNEFFRGANAMAMRPDGSGLGLYFVKKIVHLMGGRISFTSESNVGTTFTVIVPR